MRKQWSLLEKIDITRPRIRFFQAQLCICEMLQYVVTINPYRRLGIF